MDVLFSSVLQLTDAGTTALTASGFMWCTLASIVLGLLCSAIYMFKHKYSKNFVVTLALLPVIVQMVITLVNGNIGAGVAVMGVFSLVRFRSIAGTAKDIGSVFLAMAIGLATGMGYIGVAAILISAVLTAIYLMSVSFFMFFRPLEDTEGLEVGRNYDPTWKMKLPLAVLTVAIVLCGFFSNTIVSKLAAIAAGAI